MAKDLGMTLADYLAENGIKPATFAGTLGVPASTVTRILRGEREPRGATMRKIIAATDGKVAAEDLLAAPEQRPAA